MDNITWLTDSEQRAWRTYLETTQRLWARLCEDLSASSGLPMSEYDVLTNLSDAPDRKMRMSELADRVVQSRSRLTHTVRRMQDRGLVKRMPCHHDGRGVMCELTDKGYDVLVQAAPGHVESVRERLFANLTEQDVADLHRLMAKIQSTIKPNSTDVLVDLSEIELASACPPSPPPPREPVVHSATLMG